MLPSDIYACVFENSQAGLLLLEKSTGRILQANTAFLRMAARDCAEVMGRSFRESPLIADEDAGAEIHRHLLADGAVMGVELPLRAGDGRWVLLEVTGHPVGGGIQLEVRDATGRELARQAERLATLRLVAARAGAEFRDVHRSLLATGELLLAGSGGGQPELAELEKIRQSSERASAIAAQLLVFAGSAEVQVRPVALSDLVESMLPRLRQVLGPQIEIVPDVSQDMAAVIADPVQVRQIILKLAANSLDAMQHGGTFCLQTATAAAIEPGLSIAGASAGPYGVLAVSDNGPGLDDQSWEHLYEPFFTTKGDSKNLGLGLATVYGIVQQSGGRLWAYSQPGNGATFRIYLPLAGTYWPVRTEPRMDPLRGSNTILLIEADDGMRTVMANLLKKRGYRVLAALHAAEALRIADANGPPDLLICRPEPALAGRLAGMHPRLRVLYLVGYAEAHAVQEQGLPPRTSLLQKPFEPETFLAAARELLSQLL